MKAGRGFCVDGLRRVYVMRLFLYVELVVALKYSRRICSKDGEMERREGICR